MDINLDELERLAAQATPGPWVANNWGRVWYTPTPDSKRLVCDTMRNTVKNPKSWRANARLIAAMRNAVPELIARVRELERHNAGLEARLRYLKEELDTLEWELNDIKRGFEAAKEAGE